MRHRHLSDSRAFGRVPGVRTWRACARSTSCWLLCLAVPCCQRPSEPIGPDTPKAQVQTSTSDVLYAAAPDAVPTPPPHRPYPPGQWRLAPPAQLANVLLWVSQIVIRHDQVEGARVSFNLTGWQSAQPSATRTREQALALAQQVSKRAREGESFERLANEFSEEPASAERGGSLGGIPAGHLFSWPEVLDALAALAPGDVSLPVETEFGFHVLLRRNPVRDELVTGSHLLITHDDAPWGETVLRGPKQPRSRAEALALAERIFAELSAAPNQYDSLVTRYSEHRDSVRSGDFGTWSTREVAGNPREIETLTRLQLGQISAPIDTVFGFQILRRQPNQERKEYAMLRLQLRFDESAPETDPNSKQAIGVKAHELATFLKREPRRFESLLEQYCCTTPERVVAGRDLPGLAQMLDELEPGEIAAEPVLDSAEYFIPQRLPLSALPSKPLAVYQLPAPSEPDVRYHASHSDLMSPTALDRLAKQACAELGLEPEPAKVLVELHALAAATERRSVSQLLAGFDKLNADVERTLGTQQAERYRVFVASYVKHLLLLPRP